VVSHKEFLADAISNYESLPLETNDLYKKYALDIPMQYDGLAEAADPSAHEAMLSSILAEISAKTRIKFDAIISESSARSLSPRVKIIKSAEMDAKALDGKIFKSSEDKLAAFSNANAKYFVTIDGIEAKKENINLLFVNGSSLPVQLMVKAVKGSALEIMELYVSGKDNKGMVSVLHEVLAEKDSEVELNILHNEDTGTNVLNLSKVIAKDNARFRANFIYTGGQLTKSKNIVDSCGLDSKVEISELAYGNGEQRFDLGTSISNSSPRSYATLSSGALLDGKSNCMLKGYAKVATGTKGCFSRITERGILLSKDAHVDALPDMSIDYSNEVKATHSAATSPIDPESLFYLQSRGLSEQQSRKVFISAFLSKYVTNMSDGVAHELAMSIMLEKLETGSFGVIPDVTARGAWALK